MEILSNLPLIRSILNTLFHQCVAIIAIFGFWTAAMYIPAVASDIAWHASLCTLGLVPLIAESLILFSDRNVWTPELSRTTKSYIHGVLGLIGIIFIVAGVATQMSYMDKYSLKHFDTDHGALGMTFFILILLCAIFGPAAHFAEKIPILNANTIHFIHNAVGILTYIIGIAALCTGFYTVAFILIPKKSKDGATTLAVFMCIGSLVFALVSLLKQIKKLF